MLKKMPERRSGAFRQKKSPALATKTNEAAVQASFIISQVTAKKPKPFMDYEYVECIMKAAEILCHKSNSFLKISVFLQIQWPNV
jgi:hypothetical protein